MYLRMSQIPGPLGKISSLPCWLLAFRCYIKKAIYLRQVQESPLCLRHYKNPLHFETKIIVVLYSSALIIKKSYKNEFFSVTFKMPKWQYKKCEYTDAPSLRKYKHPNMTNNLYRNRTSLGNKFSERCSKFRITCHKKHNSSVKYHSWIFFNF